MCIRDSKYTICSYCVRLGIYLENKGKIWTCRKCQVLVRTKDDCNNKHACVKRLRATPESHLERNASKAARHAKAQWTWSFGMLPKQAGMCTQNEGETLASQWHQHAEQFIKEYHAVLRATLQPYVLLQATPVCNFAFFCETRSPLNVWKTLVMFSSDFAFH